MNKQQHYITMDRGYNSSANSKPQCAIPWIRQAADSHPLHLRTADSCLIPGKKYVQNTMHLQSLLADFWSFLHTAVFIGLNIQWCTAITAHFYPHLGPLSAHVLPSLHTAISNRIYYQLLYYLPLLHITIQYELVYCKYCTLLSSMDPLSARVLSSLHIAILTAIHLSAALLTLWHTAILIRILYKMV
jgi:hypothetical protein